MQISPGEESQSNTKVEVRTLDSFKLSRCDFIKIDVEGFEPAVLLGAIDTIKSCRPTIAFEHVMEHVSRAQLTGIDLAAYFRDLDYNLYQFDDRNEPTKLTAIHVYSGDILAIPVENKF